jgi:hypothetical protein
MPPYSSIDAGQIKIFRLTAVTIILISLSLILPPLKLYYANQRKQTVFGF